VNLQSLGEQLVHDVKASWQRTAILAILLCVGLVFWIPPLVRAVSGGAAKSKTAAASPSVGQAFQPAPANRQAGKPAPRHGSSSGTSTRPTRSWQHAEERLLSDPLVRSAEVAAIQSDPFHIDHDQFPPPILFAQEPAETKTLKKQTRGPRALKDLVLKSTILGVQRRAAYINSKLYFEGTEIQAGGQAYRLAAVFPRKVILQRGNEMFELKITSQLTSGNIQLDRENGKRRK